MTSSHISYAPHFSCVCLLFGPIYLTCKVRSSLALFSYCDVRVQSNPYVLKGDKSVLKRAIVRLLGGGVRSNSVQDKQTTGLYKMSSVT